MESLYKGCGFECVVKLPENRCKLSIALPLLISCFLDDNLSQRKKLGKPIPVIPEAHYRFLKHNHCLIKIFP